MEALAARIAAFCLQKHYIKPDQIAWLQYGLMRRLMGMVTFLLLLPVWKECQKRPRESLFQHEAKRLKIR